MFSVLIINLMTKNNKIKPAIFLDRDGVIIKEKNFLINPDEIKFYPGSIDALRSLGDDYAKVVVSNQSGVSRGYFSENDVKTFNLSLDIALKEFDITIDGWYFCPHGPDDGCECRKPKTGLIVRAADDLGLDLKNSWMIGDKSSDIQAGSSAGLKTILVKTGYGGNEANAVEVFPTFIADDLLAAVAYINGSKN